MMHSAMPGFKMVAENVAKKSGTKCKMTDDNPKNKKKNHKPLFGKH